jgi:hypothetical protein
MFVQMKAASMSEMMSILKMKKAVSAKLNGCSNYCQCIPGATGGLSSQCNIIQVNTVCNMNLICYMMPVCAHLALYDKHLLVTGPRTSVAPGINYVTQQRVVPDWIRILWCLKFAVE